ncbi:hypothetical protein KCV00_g40, partial [Aureobasidium melanogenum]
MPVDKLVAEQYSSTFNLRASKYFCRPSLEVKRGCNIVPSKIAERPGNVDLIGSEATCEFAVRRALSIKTPMREEPSARQSLTAAGSSKRKVMKGLNGRDDIFALVSIAFRHTHEHGLGILQVGQELACNITSKGEARWIGSGGTELRTIQECAENVDILLFALCVSGNSSLKEVKLYAIVAVEIGLDQGTGRRPQFRGTRGRSRKYKVEQSLNDIHDFGLEFGCNAIHGSRGLCYILVLLGAQFTTFEEETHSRSLLDQFDQARNTVRFAEQGLVGVAVTDETALGLDEVEVCETLRFRVVPGGYIPEFSQVWRSRWQSSRMVMLS